MVAGGGLEEREMVWTARHKVRRSIGRVLLTVLLGLALVASGAGAAAASAATASAAAADPEVFGFFTPNARDYMLDAADYSTFTTVAFMGVEALADGHLEKMVEGVSTVPWAAWTSEWMDTVLETAHAHGCKVVLTVTRFGWSAEDRATTVALLANADARALLADEIADAVVERGANGVNLDFEPVPREVKDDYVTFVRLVRQELNERQAGLFLTFDATGRIANYKIAELTAEGAADAVFLMGYPFKYANSRRAGAVSPLDGVGYGLPEALDAYLARTTPDKVILGLPYYGFEWSTETKYLHSLTRPQGETYGYERSQKIGYAIDFGLAHGRRWDAEQLVPWTRWRYQACETCPLTWRQLYYDDVQSMGLKYDLVIARGLAGVGLFKLGNDTGHPELNALLTEKFGQH